MSIPSALSRLDLAFHVGDAFRKARDLRGWTPAQVVVRARQLGISLNEQTVLLIESNHPTTRRDARQRLAQVLGVGLADLQQAVGRTWQTSPEPAGTFHDLRSAALALDEAARRLAGDVSKRRRAAASRSSLADAGRRLR